MGSVKMIEAVMSEQSPDLGIFLIGSKRILHLHD